MDEPSVVALRCARCARCARCSCSCARLRRRQVAQLRSGHLDPILHAPCRDDWGRCGSLSARCNASRRHGATSVVRGAGGRPGGTLRAVAACVGVTASLHASMWVPASRHGSCGTRRPHPPNARHLHLVLATLEARGSGDGVTDCASATHVDYRWAWGVGGCSRAT